MFEGLSEKLQETFRKLKGKGKLSEADVNQAMREIRLALLEADVALSVVKDFIARLKERSIGQEVMESLTPGQQVVKIVHEELTQLLGGSESRIQISSKPPTILMLVGLQGSGKTTSSGKLANYLRKQGRRPLLVAADIYRPAAIKQLQVLGAQLDIPVFTMGQMDPVQIVQGAVEFAFSQNRDLIIIDTAGRLHINEELMAELKAVKGTVNPHEILLVVDSMTGQDAVNVAQTFHQELDLTGVILTKMDGDTRGGAALSVKAITSCPIKFIGDGEKLDALQPFYPERLASRILGMGDVLSLIEKAQTNLDVEKARALEQKIRKQEFTLEDFLEQLSQVKSMGPLDELLGMIPGLGGSSKELKKMQNELDPSELNRVEAIINSMTPAERRQPEMINGSRRKRIASGSGNKVQDVNRLLKQFEDVRKMMKQFSDFGTGKKKKGLKLPFMPR